jgi:hypothetical protein
MGFVFIEANVKKWGLAPMTGSLAPPPPYGSEQGSILLESGRESAQAPQFWQESHSRSRSGTIRFGHPSPGPMRSPTDISLGPLPHIPSQTEPGEGPATHSREDDGTLHAPSRNIPMMRPPPEYSSPRGSPPASHHGGDDNMSPDTPPIPSYEAAVGGNFGRPSS